MPQAAAEQAPTGDSEIQTAQQIEDRLAKGFEQAEPEESQEAEAPAAEETEPEGDGLEEVEYEGETFRVAPKLKEAIIQKGDYTKKSQEVAEARRNIEHQQEQMRVAALQRDFEKSVAEPMQNLALIESRTKLLLSNWQTLSADEKQEILYLDKQREQISRDIDGKHQEFVKGLETSLRGLRAKALENVSKAIPGWKNEHLKDITEHALSEGYTNQELSSITDPRHIKTLWKAREYDRLRAQAVKTPAKVTAVKPQASHQMPEKVKQKFALKKDIGKAQGATAKARAMEDYFAKQFGG